MAAQLVTEGANAIGCAPDFLGLAMLAVGGGAIGRSVSLLLKPNYFVSPTLYAGCIGPPSDGKTPALKAAAAPDRSIDDALAAEHGAAMEGWPGSSDVQRRRALGDAKGLVVATVRDQTSDRPVLSWRKPVPSHPESRLDETRTRSLPPVEHKAR
jgi:hypothetical protein